eukprot:symbB.v1.2.013682.t2/scaffold971.1/size148033/10
MSTNVKEQLFSDLLWSDPTEHEGKYKLRRQSVDDQAEELQRLRFRGVSLLFGAAALRRLKDAHAAVLGIGGVGSWVVESLARSGIGGLTLVDLDEICISNTNRQLHTLSDTVGRAKAICLLQLSPVQPCSCHEAVRLINPHCKIETVQDFFVEETECDILDSRPFDVVVDAIDGVANKCRLIYACRERQIPGSGDGLTRRVRSTLRSKYGFPSGEKSKRWGIPVVYSPETPKLVADELFEEGDSPGKKTCASSLEMAYEFQKQLLATDRAVSFT